MNPLVNIPMQIPKYIRRDMNPLVDIPIQIPRDLT
jgi:hypothetical protein